MIYGLNRLFYWSNATPSSRLFCSPCMLSSFFYLSLLQNSPFYLLKKRFIFSPNILFTLHTTIVFFLSLLNKCRHFKNIFQWRNAIFYPLISLSSIFSLFSTKLPIFLQILILKKHCIFTPYLISTLLSFCTVCFCLFQ